MKPFKPSLKPSKPNYSKPAPAKKAEPVKTPISKSVAVAPDTPIYTALCLDLTLANCGLSVMDIYDVNDIDVVYIDLVVTEKSKEKSLRRNSDDLARARAINDEIQKIIKEFDCNIIIAEMPEGTQSSRAAFSFGTTNGILACQTLPIIEVRAVDAKKVAVNTKSAAKSKMIDWAFKTYPHLDWKIGVRKNRPAKITRDMLTAKNEHIADSIAVGHAGVSSAEFTRLIRFTGMKR